MSEKLKLAFIGAGGQSDAVITFVDRTTYDFVGYFDDKEIKEHRGHPVIGRIDCLVDNLRAGTVDVILITIGDNEKRKEIFEKVKVEGFHHKFINVIAPSAVILDENSLKGNGIFVGANAFVGFDVNVGDNSIINTGVILEHHSNVGCHCNCGPGSVINGSVNIDNSVYIGSNSTIIQCLNICSDTMIGAGAVVTKNIEKSGTYVGVPAKKV